MSPTALAYGLICLAMAYLASIMGSVLQVCLSELFYHSITENIDE